MFIKNFLFFSLIFLFFKIGILFSSEIEKKFHNIYLNDKDKLFDEAKKLYENPNTSKFEKAVSSYYLGYFFFESLSDDSRSLEQAYKFLKISADKFDYPNAFELLGIMYKDEIYVQRDYEKAIYYFQKAIEKGNYSSYGLLSDVYYFTGNWTEAELYAKKCIENYDNSKIFPTKKTNIDCTYDLAWFLYYHNTSEERDIKSIEYFKSIEKLDVRAAIFMTNYLIDPHDAFGFELELLKHIEHFDSNYDKVQLFSELVDHYNHIVKPKKSIQYANDALHHLKLLEESRQGILNEEVINIKKNMIIAYIADGNFDEARRVLVEVSLDLNQSNVYSGELSDKFYNADVYEFKFYEAEIAFHKGKYVNAFNLFKNLIEVFSANPELDNGSYLFQAHAYLASIYSDFFLNIEKANHHFFVSNETYRRDYASAFESGKISYPNFPYEVIDLKMSHLSKHDNKKLKSFTEQYLKDAHSLESKNFGLLADAYSRATIYFYSDNNDQLCIDYGLRAINFILQSERGEFHTKMHNLYEVIGDCYYRLKQKDLAIYSYNQALTLYESYLSNLRYPSAKFKNDYKNILHKIIDIKINEDDFSKDEIFQLIQKTKISFSSEAIFRNYAKHLESNTYYSLIVSKSDLSNKLKTLRTDYKRLISKESSSKNLSNIFLEKISVIEDKISKIDNEIIEKYQKQNQYYFERNLQLDQLQKNLSENEVIFNFSINKKLNFLTIVSKDDFEIFSLDKDEDMLEREVKIFLGDIIALKDISKSSKAITSSLFGKLDLNKFREKQVYLIYDQQLSNLPFSALLLNERYLIEDFQLTHIPSFPSLFYLKNKLVDNYENNLIGFANPKLSKNSNFIIDNNIISKILRSSENQIITNIQSLPELPNTETELLNISKIIPGEKKLFIGEEANEINVKKINLNSRYLVFATHALISGELDSIYESGLVLSPPDISNQINDQHDGFLSENEILNLDINTNLTLLSACNTAKSGDYSDSDSLSGLTKSFFYAGSNNVLSTLWSIETNSAEVFTNTFFENTSKNKAFSESSRLAKISLINSKKYNHAFYWAPFILAGINNQI